MRLAGGCAAALRGTVVLMAVLFGLGPALGGVRAQDVAPASGMMIASGGETVLLREQPGWEAVVLTPLGDGSPLDIAGEPVTAADGSVWLPVYAAGQNGYVPAGYVAASMAQEAMPAPDAAALSEEQFVAAEPVEVTAPVEAVDAALAAAVVAGTVTTTDANLRAAPSADAEIMQVLPPGTAVIVNGGAENGFVPVTAYDISGWIAIELLGEGTVPVLAEPAPLVVSDTGEVIAADPVELAQRNRDKNRGGDKGNDGDTTPPSDDSVSSGIIWPVSGGEWEVVQGYNNGTHTNRSNFATYKYSLDWARVDGDTAGQPIFAPVSGTIEWVDRGSGGMLINTGTGYGVALFHVTFDRDLGSGSSVVQGQRIGRISGPGDDGYMSMAHFEIACWKLNGNSHESVPFVGANAIAGREFPDDGGSNQHMGVRVTP